MQTDPRTTPVPETPKPSTRRQRTAAMVGAGLLAGLIAAGIGGVASAQSGGTTVVSQIDDGAASTVVMSDADDEAVWQQFDQCLTDAGLDLDAPEASEEAGSLTEADEVQIEAAFERCETILTDAGIEEIELSEADEAVFEQFDQCLVDAGVDFEAMDGDVEDEDGVVEFAVDEAEWEALDAAFESCEPILDNLSDDAKMFEAEMEMGEFEDFDMALSAEDEAVFEQFDQCLTDAGIDFEALDAAFEAGTATELDESQIDAAFESCEPILESLSEDVQMMSGELSAEDEAVFEQFDQCLTDAGVPMMEFEGDDDSGFMSIEIDEAEMEKLDAAFESCDPILDGLSDDVMFIDELDEGDLDEDE